MEELGARTTIDELGVGTTIEELGARRTIGEHDGRNGSGRNVEPECANGEESGDGFGEHDDGECCKRGQMTMAPGLRLERLEEGIGESCTAAEETRERTSTLLYISEYYGSNVSSSFSPLDNPNCDTTGVEYYP